MPSRSPPKALCELRAQLASFAQVAERLVQDSPDEATADAWVHFLDSLSQTMEGLGRVVDAYKRYAERRGAQIWAIHSRKQDERVDDSVVDRDISEIELDQFDLGRAGSRRRRSGRYTAPPRRSRAPSRPAPPRTPAPCG